MGVSEASLREAPGSAAETHLRQWYDSGSGAGSWKCRLVHIFLTPIALSQIAPVRAARNQVALYDRQ